jgi:uncharacterized protein (TIGR01777 family)
MKTDRIILAGGSGFTGQVLTGYFAERDREVVVLSRTNKAAFAGARFVQWDGETLGDWTRELENAVAVVNLAGRSVDCRYTAANRQLIMDSRVNSTHILGEAIVRCAQPPRVWLNSSSATIYRHTLGPPWDESGTDFTPTPAVQDEFSLEVIHAWERALAEASTPSTRKVALRTTMVLGLGKNSVFPVLRRLTRLGLGGRMGSGRQYVSWIHQADYCRAVEWLIRHDNLSGAVNLAAPNPLQNAEMMRAFRELCGMPLGLPATEWMLEVGAILLRTETELILKSRRVVPGRLVASGFEFHFPQFREALADLSAIRSSGGKP